MWADAQRDGRPAEYRSRRLLNGAVWLTPNILECRAATLPIWGNARLGLKVNFAHCKIPFGARAPPKKVYVLYSVTAQETAKHRAKFR